MERWVELPMHVWVTRPFGSSLRSDLLRLDGKGFAGKPLKFQMVIIQAFLCDKLFQKMFEYEKYYVLRISNILSFLLLTICKK